MNESVFTKGPWAQELIWVRRNGAGAVIGYSEKPPQTGDMIPTMPISKGGKSNASSQQRSGRAPAAASANKGKR